MNAMPNIQIKNVPEDVHAVYRRRAGAAGQSLQEYMLSSLIEQARRPTIDEALERISHRSGGRLGLAEATRLIREDRDSH